MLDVAGGSSFFAARAAANGLQNAPVVDNHVISDASEIGGLDFGGTIATAKELNLNQLQTGTLSGKRISFIEADLDGASDTDLFSFTTTTDTIFSSHVFSQPLGLGSDRFDTTLSLFDDELNPLDGGVSDDLQWLQNSIDVDESFHQAMALLPSRTLFYSTSRWNPAPTIWKLPPPRPESQMATCASQVVMYTRW